jgi:hypothetical protein
LLKQPDKHKAAKDTGHEGDFGLYSKIVMRELESAGVVDAYGNQPGDTIKVTRAHSLYLLKGHRLTIKKCPATQRRAKPHPSQRLGVDRTRKTRADQGGGRSNDRIMRFTV